MLTNTALRPLLARPAGDADALLGRRIAADQEQQLFSLSSWISSPSASPQPSRNVVELRPRCAYARRAQATAESATRNNNQLGSRSFLANIDRSSATAPRLAVFPAFTTLCN